MYSNYFKMSWRNLSKNKGMFSINVIGLALGISTCLIIMLFVVDELSYDRYAEKSDQIVRVGLKGSVNGEAIREVVTAAPVSRVFRSEFPEVEDATRIRWIGTPKVIYRDKAFKDGRFVYVDPNFFEIFTIPFVLGDARTALKEPNSIVITREQAIKFFGNDEPLNKILEHEETGNQYKVTGVIEKVPANSHFHFDLFASMEGLNDARNDNWLASQYYNYIVLAKGTDVKAFETKLPAIITKYMGPQVVQMGMTYDKFRENGNSIDLFVQPLTDIHLHSDAGNSEIEAGGDIKSVYIFGAVAVFMLLIACINFMNLSTAGATKRNKEIGVKKVLGSQRFQLIQQFLTESFISTCIAITLAAALIMVALPAFNQLSGKSLDIHYLLRPTVLISLAALVIFITLLAGSYPAFFLSSVRPISALRNKIANNGRNKSIRSGLVVFQFVISAGLILAIIVVNEQMSFIQNKEIGYNRNQLLVLRNSAVLGTNENAFRNQLMNDPRIESITRSAFVPAGPTDMNMTGVYPENRHEEFRRTIVYNIDDKYLQTMGMTVLTGRNFSPSPASDSLNVIINETAVKTFSLGDNPVGQQLTVSMSEKEKRRMTVIAVIKDFHFRSLHEAIAPLIMLNNPYGGLIVRTKTKEAAGLVADMESKWKAFSPDEPFSYAPLDELYNQTFIVEQKTGNLLQIFGFITIMVACLGLFGLVTFTAEQRVKEIGIRKVLGAEITQVVSLLSRDLLILVGVSFIIAFPLGYYLMNQWLQDFAYKITIEWWVYVMAAVITLLIAFFTMSVKTVRAAMSNPIDSLRSE